VNVDEIKQYRDARWVTPLEALWRIYGFDLSDRYPAILSLQLHLPDMHMMSFHQCEGFDEFLIILVLKSQCLWHTLR
jgi:hypothetical protein